MPSFAVPQNYSKILARLEQTRSSSREKLFENSHSIKKVEPHYVPYSKRPFFSIFRRSVVYKFPEQCDKKRVLFNFDITNNRSQNVIPKRCKSKTLDNIMPLHRLKSCDGSLHNTRPLVKKNKIDEIATNNEECSRKMHTIHIMIRCPSVFKK